MRLCNGWRGPLALMLAVSVLAGCSDDGNPVPPTKTPTGKAKVGTSTTEDSSKRPYVAQVDIIAGKFAGSCSGTLIRPSWVLTAGHCIADENGKTKVRVSNYRVRLGQTDSPEWVEYRVDRIVRHPDFLDSGPKKSYLHDVALVRIKGRAKIKPVRLATSEPKPGSVVTLLGWGCDRTSHKECIAGSPELKVMTMQVVTDRECGLTASEQPIFMCVSPLKPAGPDKGDSGGPLVLNDAKGIAVAGVISGGIRDFASLTSVPVEQAWIRDVTGS